MSIVLPAIYFTLLCIVLIKKHGCFEVSALIAALYALSTWTSIAVYKNNLRDIAYELPNISIWYTLTFCFLITLTILPFSWLKSEKVEKISEPKEKLFNFVSFVLIATFIVTLINLLPDLIDTLTSTDFKLIRDEVYEENHDNSKQLSGIRYLMAVPATLFGPCSPIAMIFFFYSICFMKRSVWFNMGLLLASTTQILPAILIAGRTQIIYWILIFFAAFLFFRPHLKPNQKRIIFVVGGTMIGAAMMFFLAVTISRWEFRENIANMLLIYTGEPYLQFCNFMEHYQNNNFHLQRLFPFTNYFILGTDMDLYHYRYMIINESGMSIHIFFTFLGDLLVDVGRIGMFSYCIIYCILTNGFLRRPTSDTMPFYQLLIFIICILVPLEGIFFYSFHTVRMSYYIIWTAILCFFFRFRFKRA